MGEYRAVDKKGELVVFDIDGQLPNPSERAFINNHLGIKSAPEMPSVEESPGIFDVGQSFAAGVGRGWNQAQSGVDRMVQGILETTGDKESATGWDRAAKEQLAEAETYKQIKPLTDATGFMQGVESVAGNLGQSVGPIIGSVGGGIAGAAAGAAAGGGVGSVPAAVAGFVGGAVTGAVLSAPQAMSGNAEEQIKRHGYVKNWGKAFGATAMQSAVEGLTDAVTLKVGGVLGRTGRVAHAAITGTGVKTAQQIAAEAAEAAVNRSITYAAKRIGLTAAVGGVQEAAEEVIQQGLQRWQADLDVLPDTPEAKKEYIESALVGGILGTLFGGGAGYYGAKEEIADAKKKKQAQEDIAAENSALRRDAGQNVPAHEVARQQAWEANQPPDAPIPVKPVSAKPLLLEDHSGPTREQLSMDKEETRLPPGLRDDPSSDEDIVSDENKARIVAGMMKTLGKSKKDVLEILAKEQLDKRKKKEGPVKGIISTPTRDIEIEHLDDQSSAEAISQSTGVPHTSIMLEGKPQDVPSDWINPTTAAPVQETGHGPLFTENEYRNAVSTMRNAKFVSVDNLASTMKTDAGKAQAIYNEMLKRNDGYPAGNQNQYLKITVPRGMSSRSGANEQGITVHEPGRQARDYMVKRVIPAGDKPFTVHLNGKRRGNNRFTTREEAQAWIDKAIPAGKKKDATVNEDTTNNQYGIYEQFYQKNEKDGSDTLVGERVVDTYLTEQEAQEAIKTYDPAFSGFSNSYREKPTADQKNAEIQADLNTQLGPLRQAVQNTANRILGTGKTDTDVVPVVNDRELAVRGVERQFLPDPDAIIEGVNFKSAIRNMIMLSRDFYNPSMSQEQIDAKVLDVLNHEVIHALRRLGMFTPKEWRTLTQALNQTVPGKSYSWVDRAEARNPSMVNEGRFDALVEEGIAEMFRHYIRDPQAFRGEVKGILAKIADFVKRLIGLGKKYDAEDLMDAIFEGRLADRNEGFGQTAEAMDNVSYSLWEPDNFYSKALRWVGAMREDTKAPPEQWLGMMKNAGIKKDELNWLGLEQWFTDYDQKDERGKVMITRKAVENFITANSPQITSHFMTERPFHPMSKRIPKWKSMQGTGGGLDYTEVAFTIPPKETEPDFPGSSHVAVEHEADGTLNVLAFARFKSVWDGTKKVLHILEIQSDLHQQAGKNGGYYSETLKDEMDGLTAAKVKNDQELTRLRYAQASLNAEISEIRQTRDEEMMWPVWKQTPDTKERITELRQQLDELHEHRDSLERNNVELSDEFQKLQKRQRIPNAPFKTSWEDYVIKRLIRHAAEQGFDAVSWHGELDSVRDVEQYGEVNTEKDAEGNVKYLLPNGSSKPLNLTSIVNRYLQKLPRIAANLGKPFGVSVTKHEANGSPDLWEGDGVEKNLLYWLPTPGDIFDLHHNLLESIDRNDGVPSSRIMTARDILSRVANGSIDPRQEFDPDKLFADQGLTTAGALKLVKEVRDYIYGGPPKVFPFQRYQMNLNEEMREAFERGDIPMFSRIDQRAAHIVANPNFRVWFEGSQAIDPEGNPRIFYHGTKADKIFDRFNRLSHFGSYQSANDRMQGIQTLEPSGFSIGSRLGFPADMIGPWWQGLDQDVRDQLMDQQWALIDKERTGSRIYPVFLNIRRPIDIIDQGINHDLGEYLRSLLKMRVLSPQEVLSFEQPFQRGVPESIMLGDMVRMLEKKGYDGFRYRNAIEDRGSVSFVSFRPEQVKSLFNRGSFDPADPRIDYSMIEMRGRQLLETNDEFKHWFANSRIVHENGTPYLMFTGTSKDTDFKTFKAARNGIWFTSSPDSASSYAMDNDSQGFRYEGRDIVRTNLKSRVIPAFMAISNPKIVTELPQEMMAQNYKRAQGIYFDQLKKDGYDGFLQRLPDGEIIAVAFQSNQIKSAFNEEFRKEDPRFSMIDEAPQYLVTAPLGRRVPPAPPLDRLAQVESEARYNVIAPVIERLMKRFKVGHLPFFTKWKRDKQVTAIAEGSIIQLQDRMQPLGRLIDLVRKNGGYIATGDDAYLQEALHTGQAKAKLGENERTIYEPLMKAVAGLGATSADIHEIERLLPSITDLTQSVLYEDRSASFKIAELGLYALHARERNAEMRRRNVRATQSGTDPATGLPWRQDQFDAGSGMTDYEADTIINWMQTKPWGEKVLSEVRPNSVRSLYRTMITSTNDIRVETGLNPDFRTMSYPDGTPVDPYRDYVPLRGTVEHDLENEAYGSTNTGRGFNIKGREDRTAMGRTNFAGNILAHGVLQNQEAVIRGAKNKIDQAFYRFVETNAHMVAPYAEIMRMPRTRWGYNKKTHSVTRMNDMTPFDDPTVLKLKIGGQQKYIKLHDPRLMQAMTIKNGLGDTGAGAVVRTLSRFNRYLAAINTSYNPEFVLRNALMDFQNALVNLNESQKKEVIGRITKSVPKAIKGIWKSEFETSGSATDQWSQDFKEFQRVGGKIEYYGRHDIATALELMNKELSSVVGTPLDRSVSAIKSVFGVIDKVNSGAENGVRLSTYVHLRDHYLSLSADPHNPVNIQRAQEQAAFAARNLTVNFNMGGEMKPFLNSFYLFYNASMQGSAAMLVPFIRSKRVRYIWGSAAVAGIILDMVNSLISDEDDDGKKLYDKIQAHILDKNIILMDPFGISERGYFKLPMPYLMGGVYGVGRHTSAMIRGRENIAEAAHNSTMGLIGSLNPFGTSNSWINFVAPSILDPMVDLALNENFTGAPIMPNASPFGPTEIASQRYWNNTSPWAISVADWTSRITNTVLGKERGDYVSGGVEVSPNQIIHVMDFFSGGVGMFLDRVSQLNPAFRKEDWGREDIPFLRSVYGEITERNDMQSYLEGRDKVMQVRQELKDAKKDGDRDRFARILKTYPKEYQAAARVNKIENARKKISAQIRKIRENVNIPDDRKTQMVEMLKARQDRLIGDGNRILSTFGVN